LVGGEVYHSAVREAKMPVASPLEKELKVFEERRQDWIVSHPGKFVVIRDETVLPDFFDVYEEAFMAGMREFGVDRNFLIKQIWKTEPVYFVA
jgi:hypothetical protein